MWRASSVTALRLGAGVKSIEVERLNAEVAILRGKLLQALQSVKRLEKLAPSHPLSFLVAVQWGKATEAALSGDMPAGVRDVLEEALKQVSVLWRGHSMKGEALTLTLL